MLVLALALTTIIAETRPKYSSVIKTLNIVKYKFYVLPHQVKIAEGIS